MELNEIESSCEEYPLTRGFCHLISTLVESSLPFNLGAGLRVPGFQPYLNFLRETVFLAFPTRAYRHPAEKVLMQVIICIHNFYPRILILFCLLPVGSSWLCTRSVPQTAARLWAAAVRFCSWDVGAAGWAGPSPQATRTQHHVSPAQRLTHVGALPQRAGGGCTPAGHLRPFSWWVDIQAAVTV